MRKITFAPLLIFFLSCVFALGGGVLSYIFLVTLFSVELFALPLSLCGATLTLLLLICISSKICNYFFPIPEGPLRMGSREEFSWMLRMSFWLFLWEPLLSSGLIPIPIRVGVYRFLGAKIANETYPSGLLLDPSFIELGRKCIIGMNSMLIPHIAEGSYLAHHSIRVGNGATVGAHCTILPGVQIGKGAIVATGSVVRKFTVIGDFEVWGGVPAKYIKTLHTDELKDVPKLGRA